MVTQPRLVIAATRSGDGKTTVATGLMAALRRRGTTRLQSYVRKHSSALSTQRFQT